MTDPATSPVTPRRGVLLALLTSLTAFSMAATSIYLPSLPAMTAALETTAAKVQLTLTLYMFVYAAAQLVLGPLSDRHGRRPVMIGGLAACVLASFACAFATSIEMLLVARVVQGVGACVGVVTSRAVTRDVFDRQASAKALSVITAAVALTPVAAPMIGGLLDVHFGWRATFILIAVLCAVLLVSAFLLLPETNRNKQTEGPVLATAMMNYRTLLGVPGFWGFALPNMLLYVTFYGFVVGAPLIFISGYRLSPDHYGLLAAIPMVGFFLGSFLASRLVARLGLERMVDFGTAAMGVAGAVLLVLAALGWVSITTFMSAILFWGIGMGVAQPNALAGAVSVRPRIAGSGAALVGCMQFGGGSLGTAIVTQLPSGQPDAVPLALMVGVSGCITAIAWRLLRHAARATA